MTKQFIGFGFKLLLALGMVFLIHVIVLYLLKNPLFENLIVSSYIINYSLALIIYATLFLLKKKYEHILGFIFMGGSFLKFGIYFLLFYPVFKQNGTIETLEATSFLTPYISCLIIETFYLIKLLNSTS